MDGVRVTILGCGSWGSALAKALHEGGNTVTLWGHLAEEIEPIRASCRNEKYLPGVELPAAVCRAATTDLDAALAGAEALLLVVPSQVLRQVAARVKASGALPANAAWILAAKGLDPQTGRSLCWAIEDEVGPLAERLLVLVGPSHAEEVARGLPTALVLAGAESPARAALQRAFSSDALRVYVNEDRTGTELGVALKNVVAVAAGIIDGVGLGDNTKGALISRSLAEIGRYIESHGGDRQTLLGLAGVGDLVTTCFSQHSRNRHVGEELGQGRSLDAILADMVQVAEGVHTTRTLHAMAGQEGVEMPITEQVYAVLFAGKDPQLAIRELMKRDPAPEIRKGGSHARREA
ncbi:MAG: NAD(P)H-dependent glycerol-3-phosphate dehydrogenase [Candidatus Krumholzibacteriia bacterium]|nr:NAD(P)-dependent glycerol-3-phosphate dehydrogenase [bacterium]MCB9515129.1 NAD(P)-dependent glycerol-3-phosphate dehydrogenase [Candidatus Latescibacterota bacterium]